MFTVKKTNRLKILQDVIDRNLRPGQAAEMLSITPRHCSRLLKRYRQLGPLGMNNHSRGRVGNRLLPTSLIDQALCIIREHYRDFGPTLALENLEEVHGLVLESVHSRCLSHSVINPVRTSSSSDDNKMFWQKSR
ncbi:helix-turn-helix domain-containing protein [Salmonella enterica]|uniref:helix-turn-helix domain-containing protein n=1 Tax=Salmonella enterica TaxID=28901 RepID=UPI0020CF0373|nr:helix-turn-helix domain-containing protein [Salmonella enterica]